MNEKVWTEQTEGFGRGRESFASTEHLELYHSGFWRSFRMLAGQFKILLLMIEPQLRRHD